MNNEFYVFGPRIGVDTAVVKISPNGIGEEGQIIFTVEGCDEDQSLTSEDVRCIRHDEGLLVSTSEINETDDAWKTLLNYNTLYETDHLLSTGDRLTSELKELFRATVNGLVEGE